MNKNVSILCFVLTSGLVSCSQDKTVPDQFKLNPPKLSSEGVIVQTFTLEQQSRGQKIRSQLKEQIQWEPEDLNPSIQIKVTSTCKVQTANEVRELKKKVELPIRNMSLFELVPDQIYFSKSELSTSCRFEFVAQNHIGSVHRFSSDEIEISGSSMSSTLDIHSSDDSLRPQPQIIPVLELGVQTAEIQLEPSSKLSELYWECEHHRLPIQRTPERGLFDIHKLNMNAVKARLPESPSIDLYGNQLCRLVGVQKGEVQLHSAIYRIKIPTSPKISVQWQNAPVVNPAGHYNHRPTYQLGQITIQNQMNQAIRLKFPPDGEQSVYILSNASVTTLDANFHQPFQHWSRIAVAVRLLNIGKLSSPRLIHGVLTLAPGESVSARVESLPMNPCAGKNAPSGMLFSRKSPPFYVIQGNDRTAGSPSHGMTSKELGYMPQFYLRDIHVSDNQPLFLERIQAETLFTQLEFHSRFKAQRCVAN